MTKRNKIDNVDVIVIVAIIIVAVVTFITAVAVITYEPSTAPKHGSYAKCDQYGVKGCVRWSVVTY